MTDTTFASLFSGCGCLDLGLERAGLRCVYQCEWDRYARAVLRYRFPGIPLDGDIALVKGDDIAQADVWAFGSPCKEFARCNKTNRNQGLSGKQSGLAWEVVRLLEERQRANRPRMLLWENVGSVYDKTYTKGLESWFEAFSDLGYPEIQAYLLRGPDVSIPQLRPRWFTLLSANPLSIERFEWSVNHNTAFELVDLMSHDGCFPDEVRLKIRDRFEKVWGGRKYDALRPIHRAIWNLQSPEPALLSGNPTWTPHSGIAPTLDTSNQNRVYLPHQGVRPLSVAERERLMGLPVDWTRHGLYEGGGGSRLTEREVPDSQRIKMTGNGVIVQVAELMGKLMLANLDSAADCRRSR